MVLLDKSGEHLDSEGFAKLLNTFSEKGINQISFIVGGSEGFPKLLTSKAKKDFGSFQNGLSSQNC